MDRQTDREAYRQTDRLTDREVDRQAGRDRQTDRQADRQTDGLIIHLEGNYKPNKRQKTKIPQISGKNRQIHLARGPL